MEVRKLIIYEMREYQHKDWLNKYWQNQYDFKNEISFYKIT